jgi:hypothetical protein
VLFLLEHNPKAQRFIWSLNPFLVLAQDNSKIKKPIRMTEVITEGGEVIKTDLPPEAVADLQAKEPEKQQNAERPEADPQPEPKAPEQPEKTEELTTPEVKPEPIQERPKKAGPIADLLQKKHDLEQELENERKARQELEAKISQNPQQTPSQAADSIKALAEKYGLDETNSQFFSELAAVVKQGMALPKEVSDLIQKQKEAEIQVQETQAFNTRVDRLQVAIKDDQLADPKVREKLQSLAYSTDKAPDGEPYYQKELAELYYAYIKPEVEPGKVSAESSFGAKTGGEILDFEQIHNDEAKLEEFARSASSEKWQAYEKWRDERAPDTKIIRR